MINEDYGNLFSIKRELGAGGFGSVNLAETLNGQTKVVVKFINISKLQTESEKEYCMSEPKLLRKLQKLNH